MTKTTYYKLNKPDDNDTADISQLNVNADLLDTALHDLEEGKASLGPDGKVLVEELPAMNYDPAGSAAAVQNNLSAHTSNKSNPHGVTAQQAGAAPSVHTHSAGQITSGVFPPERGGTGVTSLAALATALVGQGMSKVSVGSYTGTQSSFPTDNAADIPRTISLGFTPKAVVIITNDGTMNAPIYPGALVTFGGIAVTGNPLILKHTEYSNVYSLVAVEIVTNGFVTHHRSISAGNLKLRAVMNYASYSYTYAAFG